MAFKKILCPTDFSAGSRAALHAAVEVANRASAELVIAHASYVPPPAFAGEFVFPPHALQQVVDDAQREVDDAVREAITLGAKRVTGISVSGVPWAKIVGLLEDQAFDLCVIGTHGRSRLVGILLGSVAEKVVRHAPCSVLAVRADGVKPFAHVLVPTDFSESARHALDLAAELVQPGGAITLLHVLESPVAFAGNVTASDVARAIDRGAASAMAAEAKRVAQTAPVDIRVRSRIGYPGAQTLAAVDDDDSIDLVVMGSHGRTGISRAVLGSVAEKVVRNARCPVLVARRRPDKPH
jgi:nucleotide-binding universal stress UspA family protein